MATTLGPAVVVRRSVAERSLPIGRASRERGYFPRDVRAKAVKPRRNERNCSAIFGSDIAPSSPRIVCARETKRRPSLHSSAPSVLAEDDAKAAGRGPHQRYGLAAEDAGNIGRRPRQPVDRVLEHARDRVVVLRRDEQQPVGGRNGVLQFLHGLRDPVGGLEVAVIERDACRWSASRRLASPRRQPSARRC